MKNAAQTVVIGGGVTGLTIAHTLARNGADVVLLEAGLNVGGVVQTVEQDGFLLEQGPFTVMLRAPEFAELLDDIDLRIIEVNADASKKRYVLHQNRLHQVPASPVGLLSTSLLSTVGKFAVMGGLFQSSPRQSDADETLHEVAARRVGLEAADRMAGPAAVGIFGAEAKELSFDACLPMLANADRHAGSIIGMMKQLKRERDAQGGGPRPRRTMISFDGGLQALIDTLARDLDERVQTSCAVQSIQRVDGAFRVQHEGGAIDVESVITAVSPAVTAELVGPMAPEIREDLAAIPIAGLGAVSLGFRREDVGHSLDGFGFLIPREERHEPLLGCIWASSIFPHHAPEGHVLVRAIIGGTRWPRALEQPEEAVAQQTIEALTPLLNIKGGPVLVQTRSWPDTIPVYTPGHLTRTARIHEAVSRVPGLHCAGNWTGGLGVNDRIASARQLAMRLAVL